MTDWSEAVERKIVHPAIVIAVGGEMGIRALTGPIQSWRLEPSVIDDLMLSECTRAMDAAYIWVEPITPCEYDKFHIRGLTVDLGMFPTRIAATLAAIACMPKPEALDAAERVEKGGE